ncbi:hypothetical protein AAG570_011283 [Ranatra chinensis]|uniref:Membrane-bound transcription factor site-2 protease n=1 Tax=Ranatra chinensis TaxID=642074 RepID=A0ABD0YK88_9HEMI
MDEFYMFLIAAVAIHCCLIFFDIFFKSCSLHPYLYFLKNTGLQIQPLRLTWFTLAFNRQIQKWGTIRPRLHLAWFTAGVWVSVFLMPVALILIIHTMIITIKDSFQEEKTVSRIVAVEPMVPGWNLPTSDFGYYLFTLLISSVIHELGHAVAAVREGVHVIGVSITLFFILPVAMTHLEGLDVLSPMKQLRVLCAGVWHNIFLALVAATLAPLVPWILYPFYDFGTGVQVEFIKEGSAISGVGGLKVGDKIVQLNHCTVSGTSSWQECLVQSLYDSNNGFCIPDSFIKEHDESVPAKHLTDGAVECCAGNSAKHLCFEYIESEDEPLPLPQHSCLNARNVIDIAGVMCHKASDCPQPLHCFRPSLENSTKLIRIQRSRSSKVLFLGHPADIYHNVKVTDFVNLYSFLPPYIPDALTKLCQFITIFSSGIAVLNVIPCFYFDGQNIICTLVDVFLAKKVPLASVRHAVALCITLLGSFILILYLCIMLFSAV